MDLQPGHYMEVSCQFHYHGGDPQYHRGNCVGPTLRLHEAMNKQCVAATGNQTPVCPAHNPVTIYYYYYY
jgi:hypothetical protein